MKKKFLSMALALSMTAASVVPATAAEAVEDIPAVEEAEAVEAVDAVAAEETAEAVEAVEEADADGRTIVEGDEKTYKEQPETEKTSYQPGVPAEWDPMGDPATWTKATEGQICYEYTDADKYTYHGTEYWYSPFSYYFNKYGDNENNHLVDGKVVAVEQSAADKEKTGKRYTSGANWYYRAIPVGSAGAYILVRYRAANNNWRDYTVEETWNSKYDEKEGKTNWTKESRTENQRYNGSATEAGEPVIYYDGYKHDWSGAKTKKGVKNDIQVDAVLVKKGTASGNEIVEGFAIKKVTFKNNQAASVPSEYIKTGVEEKDGNYYNTYTSVPQLSKTDNKFFKGQPSFTITADFKGAAAEFKKDGAKALKGEQGVFKFEIARLSLGDYKYDMLNSEMEYKYPATEDTAENKKAALADLDKKIAGYQTTYETGMINYWKTVRPDELFWVEEEFEKDGIKSTKSVKKAAGSCTDDQLKKYINIKNKIRSSRTSESYDEEKGVYVSVPYVYYDEDEKAYIGGIYFGDVALYIDTTVDQAVAANNKWIDVYEDDLPFDNGGIEYTNDGKKSKLAITFAGKKLKTGPNGADIKSTDMTCETESFVKLEGVNNFEGMAGMRNYNGSLRFGHIKDDTHYYINNVK